MNRYARQMQLPNIGDAAQKKLAEARVLVVGAGGLGSAVLPALAGAGVGHMTIVDHDKVELSNLHRQPLFKMADIGTNKANAARDALTTYNPDISLRAIPEMLTPENAAVLVADADLVIDAADSFAATYVLSDVCSAAQIPLISASVLGLGGYAGIFCGKGPSYRAVFPDMPHTAQNCAEAGVLGSAVAILGSLQAHLALHVLLQLMPVQYKLISFDGLALSFGGFNFSEAAEPLVVLPFISMSQVTDKDIIVDVRGRDEAPQSPFAQAHRLSADDIGTLVDEIGVGQRVVICCRSGLRASHAAKKLQSLGISNLALLALGQSETKCAGAP